MHIDTAEWIRIIFLVSIFLLLLGILGYLYYRDKKIRSSMIHELRQTADELAKRQEEIAEEFKSDALKRAETLAQELKVSQKISKDHLEAQLNEIARRFDEVKPTVVKTYKIVDERLEQPAVRGEKNGREKK